MLPFGRWVNGIAEARNRFAATHNLPVRNYNMEWQDLSVPAPVCSPTSSITENPGTQRLGTERAAICGISQ